MITIYLTPLGVITEKDGNIKMLKFGGDIDTVARNLYNLYRGEYSLDKLFKKLRSEDKIIITSELLYKIFSKNEDMQGKITYVERRESVLDLILKTDITSDINDAVNLLREAMNKFTEIKLKDELANRDLLIINAINSYDEYNETINLFYERLREWYGVYFPELDNIITKIESYANLVSTLGKKEAFTSKKIIEMGYDEAKAAKILDEANSSKGALLEDMDIDIIRKHAETLKNLVKTRKNIEDYLENILSETAPNVTALVGSKLAARLIAKAGGIKKLATFPASTIQLLGAEKALFLALKKKGKPPKHGIIFQHPFISQSPRTVRGKIARLLAGKLAIAARVDAFGGEFIGDSLLREVEEKVDYLRKHAPKVKKKKASHKKKHRRRKR